MTRRRLLAAALLVAASSCTSSPLDGGGRARATVESVRGVVEVSAGGEPFRRAARGAVLERGDRLRTGPQGWSTLAVAGASADVAPSTLLEVRAGGVFLERGAVIGGGELRVLTRGADVRSTGVVRVDRTLTVRVGAFEGRAVVSASGAELAVERYREVSAAPGFFPKVTRPLRVDAADPWDRRLLGDELELQRSLESVQTGLQVRPRSVPFVLTSLDAASVVAAPAPAGPRLSSEEVVIAAAIAAGSAATAREAAALRAEGADWAVVAATLRADPERVLAALDGAVSDGTAAADAAEARPTPSPPTPGPSARPAGSPRPQVTPSPTTSPGPRPSPTPGPLDPVTDTVCTVTLGVLCLD